MGSEWKTFRMADISEGIFDGPHATPPKTDSGPIFLGISSLKSGRLDIGQSDRISDRDFNRWTKRVTPQEDDIVFSYETRLGEAAIIPKGLRCCLGRRLALIRPDRSKVEPRFLLYNFLSYRFQQTIKQRTIHGSTVDRIALKDFPAFPMLLPPLPEQRAIAHILGTLDDKIECNRRMNETLEKMAQAIFKSWFVDFDPVRWNMDAKNGKAVGKPPVPPEILKLFPDSFQESELGLIPKGWEVVRFCDLIAARQGKYIPKTRISDHQSLEFPFPVWGGNGVRGFASEYMYSSPVVVITCRGSNCGIVKLTESETWVSNISFACKPFMGSAFFLYIYLSLCSVLDCISGSAQPQITYSALKNKQLPFPVNALACKFFSKKIEAFYKKIMILNSESIKLAALRDTLLPKLISGELRIKDAEKFIEALS